MREKNYGGNIFLLPRVGEAAAVTTNGIVKSGGLAVMGAGIARYARDHFRNIDRDLGKKLRASGNHAWAMGAYADAARAAAGLDPAVSVVTFPTKHDWRNPSDLDLIARSCRELMAIADREGFSRIYIPMPGCSNGGLDYISQVRPVVMAVLDGRFTACLPDHIYSKIYGTDGGTKA